MFPSVYASRVLQLAVRRRSSALRHAFRVSSFQASSGFQAEATRHLLRMLRLAGRKSAAPLRVWVRT